MLGKLGRNDACWCGSNKKYKACHMASDEKIEAFARQGHIVPPRFILKNREQIEGIRESGKINTAVLDYVAEHIREGMTTEEIDRLVHDKTAELGGIPAPLGYEGFPKSVCTSINEQVCHGIPSEDIVLKDGDIINVDVSTIYHGYFSDSSRMFCIGNVSDEKKKLVDVTKECVELGLAQVKPWGFMGDMGQAVHDHAVKNGYSVVREIGGHGVGLEFHEEPFVSYVTKKGTEMLLVPGMVFTIEPMVNMGTDEVYTDGGDNWSVYTADGRPSYPKGAGIPPSSAVLDYVAEHIREGMTTEEIDRLVHDKTAELGGIPAPLGYEGFPKSVCTSINEQVCHGIPSEDIVLKDGDIINVDVSTIYHGYFSDSSRMFCIGNVSDEKKKLVDVTKECVELGLAQVKPWGFMGDMGQAVHDHAVKNGYSVVREIGGHGVGLEFHEEPFVSYVTKKGTEMLLVPGMVFTIEPMVNMGTDEVYTDGGDNWSVYTADGRPSAQWEIQVLVTETGYEVLAY